MDEFQFKQLYLLCVLLHEVDEIKQNHNCNSDFVMSNPWQDAGGK